MRSRRKSAQGFLSSKCVALKDPGFHVMRDCRMSGNHHLKRVRAEKLQSIFVLRKLCEIVLIERLHDHTTDRGWQSDVLSDG